MARTTLNIDTPLLRELKALGQREGKSLGRLVSDLLTEALGRRKRRQPKPADFNWVSRAMGARVDLRDKEAISATLLRTADQGPDRVDGVVTQPAWL